MIKAIMFDLDGTLLNTLKDLQNAVNYVLKKNDLNEISLKKTKSYIGNGVKKLLSRAINDSNIDIDEALNDFKTYYELHLLDNTKVYKGIKSLLKALKKNNYYVFVVSNKYHKGVTILCETMLNNLYDDCIGSNTKFNVKPSTDMVNYLLNKYNLKNDECIFVGDSDVDALTGKNANMKTVGVLWGYRSKQEISLVGVNHYIDNPKELINILNKENDYE